MSDLADAAARVAVLSALRAKVAAAYEDARHETGDEMDPGDRKSARLGDGLLGDVIKTKGATRATITDHDAFTNWVATHYPGEAVQAVRSSFVNKVLSDAKRYGAGVDPATGELIPGVEVETTNPYVTVRLADDAGEVIVTNWDEALHHVPELPGGQ